MSNACRACSHNGLVTVLDLGEQAGADSFPSEDDPGPDPTAPLVLQICRKCHLLQLDRAWQPGDDVTGVVSATMKALAEQSALVWHSAVRDVSRPLRVYEAASHHGGSWLPALSALGAEVVESDADLVIDNHALAHAADPAAALSSTASALAPHGTLVLEFHHALSLVNEAQIDTVRHGHVSYLSLLALRHMLDAVGLRPVRARLLPAYGGSLQVAAVRDATPDASVAQVLAQEREAGLDDPTRLRRLGERAEEWRGRISAFMQSLDGPDRVVAGYGAPSRAALMLRLAGVDRSQLAFTVDLAAAKHGRRIAGTDVPIRPPAELVGATDVVVLVWDLWDEISNQLAPLRERGIALHRLPTVDA